MPDTEFQLLLAACNAAIEERPIDVRPQHIRWRRLQALSNRHRVQALAWNALSPFSNEMPTEIATAMQAQARDIVLANLRAAAECRRLQDAFEAAGLPLLFLKGLTLGALAYRNPFLKMSADIDLLIEPDRLAEAAHELRSAGYVVVTPSRASSKGLERWHSARKESVWHRSEGGFQVDFHTRLADHPAVLQGLSAASPSQAVQVATGIELQTLVDDDLFAYLCVHGASSAWFRLKWITDLAAWLRRMSASEVERLYGHTMQLGADRAAGQALLLANGLGLLTLARDFRDRLTADQPNRWLARTAERQLFAETEPTERLFGTATIHFSQLALRPGWRFKVSECARQLRDMLRMGKP